MKLYIWKHKNRAIRPENIYPFILVSKTIKTNAFRPLYCYAFFTKRDAVNYMKERERLE